MVVVGAAVDVAEEVEQAAPPNVRAASRARLRR
jgi:hypothetical protein